MKREIGEEDKNNMKLPKIPFNILIVMLLVFALIGLYWLSRLGVEAGNAYLFLFVIGIIFLVIAFVAKKGGVDFWFEIPINRTLERGVLAFVIGILLIVFMKIATSFMSIGTFSPFLMAPLASFGGLTGYQTFSALAAVTSSFWTVFIVVISAAVIEEVVLGWCFVAIGSLVVGWGIRRLFRFDFGEKGNEIFDFIGAITFSIIMFSVLHFFNSSYLNPDGSWNWGMFMFAGGFRLILNTMIYKFGNLGLLFGIGVHMANNAVVLLIGDPNILFDALFSFPGGFLMGIIIFMIIFFIIVSIKQIIKEGVKIGKDFMTID